MLLGFVAEITVFLSRVFFFSFFTVTRLPSVSECMGMFVDHVWSFGTWPFFFYKVRRDDYYSHFITCITENDARPKYDMYAALLVKPRPQY